MIVLLNGPPRSGKDTAARCIVNNVSKNRMPFSEYKMSSPLKKMVREFFCLTMDEHKFIEEHKDRPLKMLLGKKYRDIQISLSEEWAKQLFDSSILGQIAVKNIKGRASNVVISDIGFEEEVVPIRHAFPSRVHLLRITRPDCDFSNDSRDYIPDSCVGTGRMQVVENKYDDVEIYEAQILRAMKKWITG